MPVNSEQRFTSACPCPVCGGYPELPRGVGERCYGFASEEGLWAECTREEYGQGCTYHETSKTYKHRLNNNCHCGNFHPPFGAIVKPHENGHAKGSNSYKEVDVYDYHNEKGELLYQVVRYEPKRFNQRHTCPDGKVTYSLGGKPEKCSCPEIAPVLYDLPHLLAADPSKPVFITEGEKHARQLKELGLVATSFPMGAGKSELVKNISALKDRSVVILPDNDADGKRHYEKAATQIHGVASSVKVLELSGLPEKGDVLNWLDAGNRVNDLEILARNWPKWHPNLTSHYKVGACEVRLLGRVSAGSLQRQALSGDIPPIEKLPLLGDAKLSPFVGDWAHLLSGYPKTGKTELLVRLAMEWGQADLPVLYITEEPELVWAARLARLPQGFDKVQLIFGMGYSQADIESSIAAGDERIVIVDTIRLLRIGDENDNSSLNTALTPLITLCRSKNQTLIMAHHTRKGGGEYGEAAAGGHALVGIVDVAVELVRDKQSVRRRVIRGWGRVVEVPDAVYEMDLEGGLHLLGDPKELEFDEVKDKVLEVLTEEWQKHRDIFSALEEPKPSARHLDGILHALAKEDKAERNPPLSEGPKPGKAYQWRLKPHLARNNPIVRGEVDPIDSANDEVVPAERKEEEQQPNPARNNFTVRVADLTPGTSIPLRTCSQELMEPSGPVIGDSREEDAPEPDIFEEFQKDYERIISLSQLRGVVGMLALEPVVSLDLETTGLDPHQDRIRLVQLSTGEKTWIIDAFQVPVQGLKELLESGPIKIGHNLKFDWQFLHAQGISEMVPKFWTDS
jgi:hypothetical protein